MACAFQYWHKFFGVLSCECNFLEDRFMKCRGINYDTGTRTLRGGLTRSVFDVSIVTREIEIIKSELHCNAIRISGCNIDRIKQAAEIALKRGLTVWFSPAIQYEDQQETFQYIIQAAERAEELRTRYEHIVFVTGCEFTLFTQGFINGITGEERIHNMFSPWSMIKNMIGLKRTYNKRLRTFLSRLVSETRKLFHGQITYASGTWEKPDWKLFDIAGIDHYRAAYNRAVYTKQLQQFKKIGVPLYITEFGCCTYQGAGDKGAMGWNVVDWNQSPPRLRENFIRDESEQANSIIELLEIFDREEIPGAFIFKFISPVYRYNEDARFDLDMAAYSVVKSLPENLPGYQGNLPWMPKTAFYKLGNYYSGKKLI